MKRFFSMMLIIASTLWLASCNNNAEPYVPQEVEFSLDYTFVESGSMTRATGAEVYNEFYEKYVKTKQLTPTTYSLTFTNQKTGATATINGRWDKKDGIRLPEGTYNVKGKSTPSEIEFTEWSDSVYLTFDEIVTLKKDDTQLTLTAIYDSFLLIFDKENTTNISCECRNISNSTKKKVISDENIYWIFMQQTYLENYKNNDFYLVITRNDKKRSYIDLINIPFEKGKYYYFNDMTNTFDIPPMESGN